MYEDEPVHPDHMQDHMYEEEPPRKRSALIPILAIIASLLAIVVGAAIVLYALGVFGSGGGSTDSAGSASQPAPLSVQSPAPQQEARPVSQPQPEQEVPQASVSLAPPTRDLPPIRSSFGDWQLRCDKPAGSSIEQCFLMQFVTAEDRDNVGLMVVVLRTADGQARIMRVVAPLGVLLPSGLGLTIDTDSLGNAPFVRCTPRGCVAEVILDDALLGKMQAGATATFIIFQTPEEGVGIPIALNGFGDAVSSLP